MKLITTIINKRTLNIRCRTKKKCEFTITVTDHKLTKDSPQLSLTEMEWFDNGRLGWKIGISKRKEEKAYITIFIEARPEIWKQFLPFLAGPPISPCFNSNFSQLTLWIWLFFTGPKSLLFCVFPDFHCNQTENERETNKSSKKKKREKDLGDWRWIRDHVGEKRRLHHGR